MRPHFISEHASVMQCTSLSPSLEDTQGQTPELPVQESHDSSSCDSPRTASAMGQRLVRPGGSDRSKAADYDGL